MRPLALLGTRTYLRRCYQKVNQLSKVIPTYKTLYSRDPTPLMIPDFMSDDASGPEDGEDKLPWKRQMAAHANMGPKTDAQLEKMSFWENIIPSWRSEEVSTMPWPYAF